MLYMNVCLLFLIFLISISGVWVFCDRDDPDAYQLILRGQDGSLVSLTPLGKAQQFLNWRLKSRKITFLNLISTLTFFKNSGN